MAKWSVALFGHHKPRFELREIAWTDHIPIVAHGYHGEPYYYNIESYSEPGKGYAGTGYHAMTTDIKRAGTVKIQKRISTHVEMPVGFDDKKHFVYNVVEWEKRARPADIITFKQHGKDWTDVEKQHFLIVTLEGLEENQLVAICERLWDTNSYKVYNPLSFKDWEIMMTQKANQSSNPELALYTLNLNKEDWYQKYVDGEKEKCAYPQNYLKKRRFHIPINDLKNLGVDENEMLCTECSYVPQIRNINRLECFDKLNNRYVLESDGLNTIQPIIYGSEV